MTEQEFRQFAREKGCMVDAMQGILLHVEHRTNGQWAWMVVDPKRIAPAVRKYQIIESEDYLTVFSPTGTTVRWQGMVQFDNKGQPENVDEEVWEEFFRGTLLPWYLSWKRALWWFLGWPIGPQYRPTRGVLLKMIGG